MLNVVLIFGLLCMNMCELQVGEHAYILIWYSQLCLVLHLVFFFPKRMKFSTRFFDSWNNFIRVIFFNIFIQFNQIGDYNDMILLIGYTYEQTISEVLSQISRHFTKIHWVK